MTGKTDILTLRQKALLSALTDVLKQANVTNKDGIQNISSLIQKQFDHPTFFDKSAEQAAMTQAGAFKDSNGGISAFEQRAVTLLGTIMDTTLMRSLKEKGLLPDTALEMDSADSYQASADFDEKNNRYVIRMSSGCFNPKNYDGFISEKETDALLAKDMGHEMGHLVMRAMEAQTLKKHQQAPDVSKGGDPTIASILKIKDLEARESVSPAAKQGRLNGEEIFCDIVGALAAKQAGYDLAVSEKYYQVKSQTLGKADLATHHPAAKTRAQALSLVNKHATRGLKNILRTAQRATAEQAQANRTPILTTQAALRKSASAER